MVKKMLKQILFFLLGLVLFMPGNLLSQEAPLREFTVYGVSKIADGDLAQARQEALLDAQRKAVMHAIHARVSIQDMIKYSHTLRDVYYNNFGFYLDSFRILNEHHHFGIYTIALSSLVNEEALTGELASVGVLTVKEKPPAVLFMIAEKGTADKDYTFWWSEEMMQRGLLGDISSQMSSVFTKRGFEVIDPFEIGMDTLRELNLTDPEPDIQTACSAARDRGAKYLIIGTAELVKTEIQPSGPLLNIQCNIQARVFDTGTARALVHVSTHQPGTHIDERSAAHDAIMRTTDRFSEKVFERIYSHTMDTHHHTLIVHLPANAHDTASEMILNTLEMKLPELRVENIDRSETVLQFNTEGKLSGADISEALLRTELDGFSFEFVSAKDTVLKFNFTKK